MPAKAEPPCDEELQSVLGSALALWNGIMRAMEEAYPPLERLWKPSKAEFGRMCLLQHKKRTLLYMTPDKAQVWIAVVLGQRGYDLAMASALPAAIKKMLSEAKPYAEGRGIRFAVDAPSDIPMISSLVEMRLARA